MMDANEEIGINSKGIATLLSECSLTDLLQHRHPTLQSPVTYNRGTKTKDYILGTSNCNEAVERCRILPFNHHMQADHRSIYIDFHANKLVGGNQHDMIAAFKNRQFQSTNPEECRKYLKAVKKYWRIHKIVARIDALEGLSAKREDIQAECEKLDHNILGRAMIIGRAEP